MDAGLGTKSNLAVSIRGRQLRQARYPGGIGQRAPCDKPCSASSAASSEAVVTGRPPVKRAYLIRMANLPFN